MIIFICGFMGAGKSTLLKHLNSYLKGLNIKDLSLLDLDDEILEDALKPKFPSIARFISTESISLFRVLEQIQIEKLVRYNKGKNLILTLGGGALEVPEILKLVEKSGKLLWLNTDFETCFDRIKNDESRPVATNNFTDMKALYDMRAINYVRAVDCGDAEHLTKLIKEWIYV